MTGRYPIHTGLQHEVIYAGQRAGLPLGMKTLAEELRDHGKTTSCPPSLASAQNSSLVRGL